MSLLAPTTAPTIPAQVRLRSEIHQIKHAPRRMADQIIRQWETSFDMLWTATDGITPADRLVELGTDAAELFAANTELVTFLAAMLTGKDDALLASIMTRVATIPAYTAHEDGTVTLD